MKYLTKKIVAIGITFLMLFGLLPMAVSAEEDSSMEFGTAELYSTFNSGQILTDSFYYTDDWFFEDSVERNDSLALVSMQLTAAAVEAKEDGRGSAFLQKLGFTETGFVAADPDDPYGLNYTWGKKTISSGGETSTLVAILVQSGYLDQETKTTAWKQNFMVNGETTENEHDAFSKAADQVLGDIASLGSSGDVRFWITGHSRGGALANLIAAHLPDYSDAEIFAYTFESPAVVDSSATLNQEEYSYIHNYLCTDDIVTNIPIWGMTRYGNEYQLNTSETNEQLAGELKKLGSGLYDVAVSMEGSAEPLIERILQVLGSAIPTRAEYSEQKTDVFQDDSGNKIQVSYVYQDVLVHVTELAMSGAFSGINANALMPYLDQLVPAVISLAKARKYDSDKDYYAAAKCLEEFIQTTQLNIPLSVEELYAILKMTAPLLVDGSAYDPENEPADMSEAFEYLAPLIDLFSKVKTITVSHHFDSVIARLHVLAPAPVLENQDIKISEPAAGDAVTKAPEEAEAWGKAQGASWMNASAKWEMEGETLPDNTVQYLDVSLTVTGHTVPEDFMLTLNGKEPLEPPTVTYADGVYTVNASYVFVLGEVESVTVSFADPVHAAAPDPVKVPKGMKLKYVLKLEDYGIVRDDTGIWKFNGWYNENGVYWKELIADSDLTLYAGWTQMIDNIEISFEIPDIGEEFAVPTVPEGADYFIPDAQDNDNLETHVSDSEWNIVTSAENVGPYILTVVVMPVDGKQFLAEPVDWGEEDYIGTAYVNGVEVESHYESEGGYLRMEYAFTAHPSMTYSIVEGDRVSWVKGSGKDLTITVKRSEEDETCFDHFRKVYLGGYNVAEDDYEAKAGSTIITLKAGLLEGQDLGEIPLRVYFDDGFADTTLSIQDKETPEEDDKPTPPADDKKTKPASIDTGDHAQTSLWIIILAASVVVILAVVVIFIVYSKKKRKNEDGRNQ